MSMIPGDPNDRVTADLIRALAIMWDIDIAQLDLAISLSREGSPLAITVCPDGCHLTLGIQATRFRHARALHTAEWEHVDAGIFALRVDPRPRASAEEAIRAFRDAMGKLGADGAAVLERVREMENAPLAPRKRMN